MKGEVYDDVLVPGFQIFLSSYIIRNIAQPQTSILNLGKPIFSDWCVQCSNTLFGFQFQGPFLLLAYSRLLVGAPFYFARRSFFCPLPCLAPLLLPYKRLALFLLVFWWMLVLITWATSFSLVFFSLIQRRPLSYMARVFQTFLNHIKFTWNKGEINLTSHLVSAPFWHEYESVVPSSKVVPDFSPRRVNHVHWNGKLRQICNITALDRIWQFQQKTNLTILDTTASYFSPTNLPCIRLFL